MWVIQTSEGVLQRGVKKVQLTKGRRPMLLCGFRPPLSRQSCLRKKFFTESFREIPYSSYHFNMSWKRNSFSQEKAAFLFEDSF